MSAEVKIASDLTDATTNLSRDEPALPKDFV